ncbi:hypothetical protein GLOTRDRAFT_140656 [Gloeophyllum trabeum ATCC 11539]|uniref:Uncharacterized protein n=1 Tax=Gloeophyllum trabeum (strain ATCC 11539 / FP-39264 / Madison 617) TaxID=670483 RepID=S7RDH5_GLOTA|nr:uncharacterized protein GLOTRDRAFT_140656 [Gloeophyllum trabeum ATCC 11539]EPQ52270.1 hypothetical protein GLOTRDRAFT_140656 [Gloeophyllum trabeum ATCC 11539]
MSTAPNRTLMVGAAAAAAGLGVYLVRSSAGSMTSTDPRAKQPEDANSTMQQSVGDVRQKTAAATGDRPSNDR